jgi:restriction system protein
MSDKAQSNSPVTLLANNDCDKVSHPIQNLDGERSLIFDIKAIDQHSASVSGTGRRSIGPYSVTVTVGILIEKDHLGLRANLEGHLELRVGFVSYSFSFSVDVAFQGSAPAGLLGFQGVLYKGENVRNGEIIVRPARLWREICERLVLDWRDAYEISPEIWEELVAGAFAEARFDEVILTPRSRDGGKDVIAVRRGPLSMKVFASVKAYGPDNKVKYDDVRALAGVVNMDVSVTKGILATTSTFPPLLLQDEHLKNVIPHRIELMDGPALQKWLESLLNRSV